MEWQDILEQKCQVKILKTKKYFSRRNEVFFVDALQDGGELVQFAVKINKVSLADQEAFILQQLRKADVKVPSVIWHDDQIIIMEYIRGILLADLLAEEKPSSGDWVDSLAGWLWQLHSFQKIEGYVLCMPDLTLRNFIYNGNDFYGLDFEELIFDRPERDLGGLSAFILNNNPMFTSWKFAVVSRLVNSYGKLGKINKDMIRHYFFREMEQAAERRTEQRDYLLAKVKELKGENLFSSGG